MNSPPSRINAGIQAAAPSVDPSSVGQPGKMLLTRVSLAFIDQRINLYLGFGRPRREVRIDRWQRGAFFVPNTIFARVLWQGNDYGTTRWQLMVLQACKPLDAMQRIRAVGATWLDQQLIVGGKDLGERGFGADVREALLQRSDFLLEQGLAERRGQLVMLNTAT